MTPNVKKRELFELFIPLVFWRNFFSVVNAKELEVLTDKILLDRFFLILIAITIACAQRSARQTTCLPATTSDELIACF